MTGLYRENPKPQTSNPKQIANFKSRLDTRDAAPETQRHGHQRSDRSNPASLQEYGHGVDAHSSSGSALGNKELQDEIYKTLFEITKNVELIKKRLAKLESGSDTPEL